MAAVGLLAGRLALVTGGGSGIGRAVCQVLAREGASIAVVDINHKNAEETIKSISKGEHKAFEIDVSSSESVYSLMADVKKTFNGIPTIAVNSAGITRDAYMLKMTDENFDKVINVNLKGTYLINKAVTQALVETKTQGGSIVNFSSIVGKIGNMGQTNYAASKAGVIGLTKSAAKELAKFGIRVNAILPGFIETPMTAAVPEHLIQMTQMLIPMTRLGKPEEVAEVCAFLASDRSSYVTGACLEVTGGLAM